MKRRGFLKGVLAALAAAPVAAVAARGNRPTIDRPPGGNRPRWDGEDLPIAFDTPEPAGDVSCWSNRGTHLIVSPRNLEKAKMLLQTTEGGLPVYPEPRLKNEAWFVVKP